MEETIQSLLAEIAEVDNQVEKLRHLKTAVFGSPVDCWRETISFEQLENIFSLLYTNDKEQIELCVEILGRVLGVLDPVRLARNSKAVLHNGLNHPDDSVKMLALTQIGRVVDSTDGIVEAINNPGILQDVIQCLGVESIGTSKKAISVLSKLCNTKTGLDALFCSNLLKHLKDVMSINEIVRYRGYEICLLFRATALEMVSSLAESQHCRQYLSQQGIMDKISSMIVAADSDPLSSFYLPGLVKFFGNLTIMDSPQQVCENYPAFLSTVFAMAMSSDSSQIPVALDTLGVLGGTVEGKQVLHKTGEQFNKVMKQMSQLARDGATELRVRTLEAIAQLLTLPVEQQTDDLLLLTESWFCSLSSQPLEMIRDISTQPFPELHCSALRTFIAIACQPWGQRMMMSSPGFAEWVVERPVSNGKEAKDCKFALVGALLSSPSTQEIFGTPNYLKLKRYLVEGPYHVTAIATVSTEGAE
ncbi:26S proteasome non-ATPase regulatory subunit 5 [Bagarius yarrelli]|uniref:26S proteasome non-ATPase regulatory subunit 5 n=1 Tax=Bagarius yarrelli TaxID=175774 RepID=A0A556TU57_BAGYA|nr:26S proteasome non-ATPase regulatory subunit 5 [Bagarius yarrelli]